MFVKQTTSNYLSKKIFHNYLGLSGQNKCIAGKIKWTQKKKN